MAVVLRDTVVLVPPRTDLLLERLKTTRYRGLRPKRPKRRMLQTRVEIRDLVVHSLDLSSVGEKKFQAVSPPVVERERHRQARGEGEIVPRAHSRLF